MRYAMIGILLVLCGSTTFADEITDLRVELAKVKQQNDELKTAIVELEKERLSLLQRVVTLTDTVNEATAKLSQLQKRVLQLKQSKPERKAAPDAEDNVQELVNGLVTAIGKDGRIEVSVGSDDGLKIGDTIKLKRGTETLVMARISKVTSDRAVADLVGKPGYPVQKGDSVHMPSVRAKQLEALPDSSDTK